MDDPSVFGFSTSRGVLKGPTAAPEAAAARDMPALVFARELVIHRVPREARASAVKAAVNRALAGMPLARELAEAEKAVGVHGEIRSRNEGQEGGLSSPSQDVSVVKLARTGGRGGASDDRFMKLRCLLSASTETWRLEGLRRGVLVGGEPVMVEAIPEGVGMGAGAGAGAGGALGAEEGAGGGLPQPALVGVRFTPGAA